MYNHLACRLSVIDAGTHAAYRQLCYASDSQRVLSPADTAGTEKARPGFQKIKTSAAHRAEGAGKTTQANQAPRRRTHRPEI